MAPELQAVADAARPAALACAALLLLTALTALIDGAVERRVAGLRRRRPVLLGPLADAVKLLSRRPTGSAGRLTAGLAVVAVLAPVVALAGALPGLGGFGGLLPPSAQSLPLAVGLFAALPAGMLAAAATVAPSRRGPLSEVIVGLLGAVLVLGLTAAAAGGAGGFAGRSAQDWPLWPHLPGAVAYVWALALTSRALQHATGWPGPAGRPPAPGLAAGGGAGGVLLLGLRHLWVATGAVLGAQLYLGSGAAPPDLGLWAAALALVLVVGLLRAAPGAVDPADLGRRAWGRLLPLALLEVALTAAARQGLLPWS